MNGTEMIDRVAADLFDQGHERWPRDMVAKYVTWAQDWVVSMRPDANSTHETVSLAAGTEQSLSSLQSKGWRVVRGARNTTGRTMKTVSKQYLDALLPNDWPDMDTTLPFYVATDQEDYNKFWVWPPADAGDSIVALVEKGPGPNLTVGHETLSLSAGSEHTLTDYVASAWRIVRGVRNSSGRTLLETSKRDLDRFLPNDWPVFPANTPFFLAVDRMDHDRFWVWPGAVLGDSITIVIAKRPSEVTTANEADEMDLGEYLREPLADMALSFALRRNAADSSIQHARDAAARAEQTLSRVLPVPSFEMQQDNQMEADSPRDNQREAQQ